MGPRGVEASHWRWLDTSAARLPWTSPARGSDGNDEGPQSIRAHRGVETVEPSPVPMPLRWLNRPPGNDEAPDPHAGDGLHGERAGVRVIVEPKCLTRSVDRTALRLVRRLCGVTPAPGADDGEDSCYRKAEPPLGPHEHCVRGACEPATRLAAREPSSRFPPRLATRGGPSQPRFRLELASVGLGPGVSKVASTNALAGFARRQALLT